MQTIYFLKAYDSHYHLVTTWFIKHFTLYDTQCFAMFMSALRSALSMCFTLYNTMLLRSLVVNIPESTDEQQ